MLLTHKFYTITALSVLHAGRGDANFGVVDNEVQRDPITDLPNIHASSLKGALREFVEHALESKKPSAIKQIFGGETNDKEGSFAGKVKFYEARLLGLPVRSDARPYFIAISPSIAGDLLNTAQTLGVELGSHKDALQKIAKTTTALVSGDKGAFLELFEIEAKPAQNDFDALEPLLGKHIAVIPDDKFQELAKELPVIARNNLENGISKNLFYEEVLPRETRLWFMLGVPSDELLHNDDKEEFYADFKAFEEALLSDTPQIGANASVGYGLTKIKAFQ
jgi:CRISPR-associated protein Cmr4